MRKRYSTNELDKEHRSIYKALLISQNARIGAADPQDFRIGAGSIGSGVTLSQGCLFNEAHATRYTAPLDSRNRKRQAKTGNTAANTSGYLDTEISTKPDFGHALLDVRFLWLGSALQLQLQLLDFPIVSSPFPAFLPYQRSRYNTSSTRIQRSPTRTRKRTTMSDVATRRAVSPKTLPFSIGRLPLTALCTSQAS
jgi:hypothetical protein